MRADFCWAEEVWCVRYCCTERRVVRCRCSEYRCTVYVYLHGTVYVTSWRRRVKTRHGQSSSSCLKYVLQDLIVAWTQTRQSTQTLKKSNGVPAGPLCRFRFSCGRPSCHCVPLGLAIWMIKSFCFFSSWKFHDNDLYLISNRYMYFCRPTTCTGRCHTNFTVRYVGLV